MKQDYLKKKKILLVDDEQEILYMVQGILAHEGYLNTRTAGTVREAMAAWKEWKPELVLLDVMLPDGDGFELLEAARAFSDIPVLFLSARGEDEDRFRGLGLGADDYLVKPFAPEELFARIRALERRPVRMEFDRQLACGDVTMNLSSRVLWKENKKVELSKKEMDLLEFLIRNKGQILTRELLLNRVWGLDSAVEEGNLDNYIYFLRRRLKQVGSSVTIKTVRSVGYSLEEQPEQ